MKYLLQNLVTLGSTEPFDLEQYIADLSIQTVLAATVLMMVLVVLGIFVRNHLPRLKAPVFILMVLTIITTTAVLAVSTVYLNVRSWSGGPVHWHADFEIWACGEELELRDPSGWWSNKIGTSTLHEHNDQRIHLEGVVVEPHDASVGKFFRVIGGHIDNDNLTIPLNDDEIASYSTGQTCPDGSVGEVQVFLYSSEGKTASGKNAYRQQKLENPQDHIIAPESQVPPGDCLIIEFGPPKDRTDRKCLQYQVQDEELENYEEVYD